MPGARAGRIADVTAVYFDHNATTPLDPRVRAAMLPWLGERWGNPSSAHRAGQAALDAVETAREQVAALIDADPLEIVFTASGTEANNAVVMAALLVMLAVAVLWVLLRPLDGRGWATVWNASLVYGFATVSAALTFAVLYVVPRVG